MDAAVGGGRRGVGTFCGPLPEATLDPAYALVAPRLLQAALEEEPLLFLVGMVDRDRPIARLVRALGWRLTPIPFYFKPLRPARFLRELRYLRRRAGARLALDLATGTGAGGLGLTPPGPPLRARVRGATAARVYMVQRLHPRDHPSMAAVVPPNPL